MTTSPIKVCIDSKTNSATGTVDWFLRRCNSGNSSVPEEFSQPTPSTFKPLINGKDTFEMLYQKILEAKSSIDIAIWGFQPSMFFRRDGNNETLCIGDLLLKKALENPEMKIRLLVWDMPFQAQTFTEANQGNISVSGTLRKNAVDGVTDEQKKYDRLWFKAINGDLPLDIEIHSRIGKQNLLADFNSERSCFGSNNVQLEYRTRDVSRLQSFSEKDAPIVTDLALTVSLSHHQKTVLIDYEYPDLAVGFVLEHNMIDNYWDTNDHFAIFPNSIPSEGRNYPIPYQDVSSIVTGGVLWDIHRNFEQSWHREDWFGLGGLRNIWNTVFNFSDAELVKRERSLYKPNPEKGANGDTLMAQILRTYDIPDIEDIKEMYLKNITQTTSYIYTENQYVRYPPLVEQFIKHWENLKQQRTDAQPIHWFIVTNSSDEGVENGAYNADRMFRLLGRRDVMPNVGEKIDEKDLSSTKTESDKQLFQNLADTIGIRTHICTLAAQDRNNVGTYLNDLEHEVYVHSKVTIIDDVFSFIGSANLNYRSMNGDTELGIITECKKVNQKLRQDLWALHTGKSVGKPENPVDMSNYQVAQTTFKEWIALIEDQIGLEIINEPLREFYRPTIGNSRID